MFEFQDNFLMGPKTAIQNGDFQVNGCTASNAAEDQLAELARVVGGGTRQIDNTEGMPLIEDAPALEFDLESELSKAFDEGSEQLHNSAQSFPEPQPMRDTAAIESAFSPKQVAPEPEASVDFSDMIGDELERALQEEVAADGSLGELASIAPPTPQETLAPWDAPEVVEAPEMPMETDIPLQDAIQETVQQSFDAPQMADFNESSQDYSDPAALFDEIEGQHAQPADTGSLHIESVLGGAAALGLAATSQEQEAVVEQPPQAFDPASIPHIESGIAYDLSEQFDDDSVSIPEPHMISAVGGSSKSGRRTAIALVAIALLGGGATLAWNSSSVDNGAAPTILASSEPVKMKPKDAGGKIVPNQDLAVYKTVDGAKTAAPKQKKLADKTEKPIVVAKVTKQGAGTAENDGTTTGGLILKPRRVRTVVVKPDGTIISSLKKQPKVENTTTQVIEPVLALKPKLVSVSAEATIVKKAPSKKVTYRAPQAAGTQAKPATAPVKVAKLQPQPAKLKPVVKPVKIAPVKKVIKKAPAKKVVAKTTPSVSSPYAVQIASQRSAAAAQKSYKSLSRRYASVLRGKGVDIRKGVIKGKGTYYRVRIPAQSKAAARKICGQLKAKGGACFVTR
ncbi:MAG: SPOR domain-containing protein [Rhizobiaceae bacterium]